MNFIFETLEDDIFKFFSVLILMTFVIILFLAYLDDKNYSEYDQKRDFVDCLIENPRYICDEKNEKINEIREQKKEADNLNDVWNKL